MEKLTYRKAYDKIIQAYFRDEIKPFKGCFCFCGTLNNNNKSWVIAEQAVPLAYSSDEFYLMEKALYLQFQAAKIVTILHRAESTSCVIGWENASLHPNYENALFAGMCKALDVLKEIHRARGEDVDGVEVFTKRNHPNQLCVVDNGNGVIGGGIF